MIDCYLCIHKPGFVNGDDIKCPIFPHYPLTVLKRIYIYIYFVTIMVLVATNYVIQKVVTLKSIFSIAEDGE